MNEAEKEMRFLIGDYIVSAIALKHRVRELEEQLAEAKARIEELEQPTRIAAE